MNKIIVKAIKNPIEMARAMEIRRQVFQIEQDIDPKLDFDQKDGESVHFMACAGHIAVGTARIRYISKKTVKLERLAVLKNYRRSGIGKKIMDFIISYLRENVIACIVLNSQEHAKIFYKGLGFTQVGEIFEEAGIPHIKMQLFI
jgi:predicted GNAT family N-acyltransferase